MSEENKNEQMGMASGGAIIATAGVFDAVQSFLAFTIIGYLILWLVSFWAFLILSIWLAFKGAYSLTRGLALCVPLAAGCIGVPLWTASVWRIVAQTIATNKLNKIAPGTGAIVNKIKL